MKSEVYFLAKAALVLTVVDVVDSFLPRAEIFAKNRKAKHNHDFSNISENKTTIHPSQLHYHWPHSTEINMGLFDRSSFHGGGTGASKQALDEQWKIQQDILRERRGHTNTAHEKETKINNMTGSNKQVPDISEANNHDDIANIGSHDVKQKYKMSIADLFLGATKFQRD